MAGLCELCQNNNSVCVYSGVSLCDECVAGYLNSLKGKADDLLYFANIANFPNATPIAKKNIVEYLYTKLSDDIRKNNERTFKDKSDSEGYYEFSIINILDSRSGNVDLEQVLDELNKMGREGWQIKCAFSNEIVEDSSSIDQSVLILERFVKFTD